MQKKNMKCAKGAQMKPLIEQAVMHHLYEEGRVFEYLFQDILDDNNGVESWCCVLAFEKDKPVAVALGTDMWVGVYTLPSHRRQGIASALINHHRHDFASLFSCTDDPEAMMFFQSLNIKDVDEKDTAKFKI